MPYTIRHDPSLGVLEVTFAGTITPEVLRDSNAECIAMQKSTGAMGFLVDAGGWELTAPMIDVYELPTKVYPQQDLDRRTRSAIMMPPPGNARQGALFFQDVCRNRGWSARIFDDRAAAFAWLSTSEGKEG